MIVDTHTHVFPREIACRTLDALSAISGNQPATDGTIDGLISSNVAAGVSLAINLPVLTRPQQFDGTNRFAHEINATYGKSSLLSFAGIHPACERIAEKMRYIRQQGFLGVKIHPDYQGTFIDDDAYYNILKCAKDDGLIVVTHAGVDSGFPNSPVRCTPARAAKLLDRLGGYEKLVLAHLGGSEMVDDVIRHLCGKNLCFDTAYSLPNVTKEQFLQIVSCHGTDRILFATDSPWRSVAEQIELLKGFGLPAVDEEKIFAGNAMRLLGKEVK